MASHVLTDVAVLFGSHDIAGRVNSGTLTYEAEELDSTTFGSGGSRERVAGLTDLSCDLEGFVSISEGATSIDKLAFDNVGVLDGLLTIGPTGADDNERAFVFRSVQLSYSPGGSVGELMKFSAGFKGRTDQFGGTVLHDPDTSETVSGQGTARELGAVGATQSLYAALHVVEFTGLTSLDVKVASDSVGTFLGTPEDRITFTQATGITSEWGTPDAGAHADTWYRVEFTIVGTGSAKFVVAVGIK